MPEWGARFDAMRHKAKPPLRMARIAARFGRKVAGVRHWINGTRDVSLNDFLELCAAAKFDSVAVLFGAGYIPDDIREKVQDLSRAILQATPSACVPKKKTRA